LTSLFEIYDLFRFDGVPNPLFADDDDDADVDDDDDDDDDLEVDFFRAFFAYVSVCIFFVFCCLL